MSNNIFGDSIEENNDIEIKDNDDIAAEEIVEQPANEDISEQLTDEDVSNSENNEPEEEVVDTDIDKVDSTEQAAESPAERNFAAIRESKRKLEAQLAEQANKLQAFEEAQQKQKESNIDNDIDLDDEDKIRRAYEQQQINMQQMYAQTQAMQAEIRLKQKYLDFEEVVSSDNVDILKTLYPKAAYEIINEKDIYAKAEKAYEAMKRYNIFTVEKGSKNKSRIAKNIAKPRPLSSTKAGSPALGAANAFAEDSPEEKRRVFAEMQRLAKGG